MAKKLKIYNGASWEDVTFAITPPNTAVTNAFTTNQVIDASTSVAALRVTQRGAGEAFRVEDDTNPDSTPFIINSAGNVGVGTTSLTSATGYASITMDGTSGTLWSAKVAGTETFRIQPTSIATTINQIANTPILFNTNNIERMRINAAGNVGIGTSSPLSALHVAPLGNTPISGPASGTWAARIIQQQDNNTFHGLSVQNRWGNNDGIIFQVAGGWNGAAEGYFPALTVNGIGQTIVSNSSSGTDAAGVGRVRNTFASTSAPSGGSDGDIWAVYTA
jgi:hypothetical protein